MANSLRAKISKLRHDGNITDAEYQELIKKLDGHDAINRAINRMNAIDEFKRTLIEIGFSRLDGRVSSKEIEFYARKLKEQE